MTDRKFTDDEIIHSLKVCSNDGDCSECLINPHKGNYGYCTSLAIKVALDLINRQKAEIEKLEKLDELAERSIEASTAVINDLRSEVALLNDANTNLQDLYQAEKSKVLKKQEKLIMAYRKLQTAKSEAIKEFAKRLKAKEAIHFCKCGQPFVYTDLFNGEIDNIVKEMTEGTK